MATVVGDLRAIRRDSSAHLRPLTAKPSRTDVEALSIEGPPTSDPLTTSFDLYYSPPKEADFRPGERVAATLKAPGLSALEVETLVTTPIERAVHGVAFVSKLRSKSVIGLSSVLLIFDDGTDVMQARQLVQERLANLSGQLPTSAKAPVMLAPLSSFAEPSSASFRSR